MIMKTQDCLKKALLDTQERVRDFMDYSDRIEDEAISHFFREYAETEGMQASRMQEWIQNGL